MYIFFTFPTISVKNGKYTWRASLPIWRERPAAAAVSNKPSLSELTSTHQHTARLFFPTSRKGMTSAARVTYTRDDLLQHRADVSVSLPSKVKRKLWFLKILRTQKKVGEHTTKRGAPLYRNEQPETERLQKHPVGAATRPRRPHWVKVSPTYLSNCSQMTMYRMNSSPHQTSKLSQVKKQPTAIANLTEPRSEYFKLTSRGGLMQNERYSNNS